MQDVVIVGGGIAGGAFATVLARRGLAVTLLERQTRYHDRVRGEYMVPWGVAEAQRLDLLPTLLDAGGFFPERQVGYDENCSAAVAEERAIVGSSLLPGVPGALCINHPAACEALSRAAAAAGATVVHGADRVRVVCGDEPEILFHGDGQQHHLRCRLVVGADGRTSTVRAQAGISLQRSEATHTVVGLLVDNVPGWPQTVASSGTVGDVMYFVFPQGDARLRLYACTGMEQRDRFTGAAGTARLLATFREFTCFPSFGLFDAATPIGPCATLTGEDSWIEEPFSPGIVLIGDAAGYNDPIIGQGLSIALRDVRVVSDLLLSRTDWSPAALRPYAQERVERMRRLRFAAEIRSALSAEFGPAAAERRADFARRSNEDPSLRLPIAAVFLGPEKAPEWAFTETMRERILGAAATPA
jgi:2-polyprenyl-6-methoxyphenol hydroxylase-like FAD-dependent oxidoreductase